MPFGVEFSVSQFETLTFVENGTNLPAFLNQG